MSVMLQDGHAAALIWRLKAPDGADRRGVGHGDEADGLGRAGAGPAAGAGLGTGALREAPRRRPIGKPKSPPRAPSAIVIPRASSACPTRRSPAAPRAPSAAGSRAPSFRSRTAKCGKCSRASCAWIHRANRPRSGWCPASPDAGSLKWTRSCPRRASTASTERAGRQSFDRSLIRSGTRQDARLQAPASGILPGAGRNGAVRSGCLGSCGLGMQRAVFCSPNEGVPPCPCP